MSSSKTAKTIKNIFDAIVIYITNNSTFESHEAINLAIKKIECSVSIEDIFRIPIEDRLFSFTKSLQWLYFVCFILKTIKEEYINVPGTFNINFSVDNAIIYLSNKYSAANKTFYVDYFNESESESE